jgi:hypothetical protein
MTVKERLVKRVETLPQEKAEKILHFAETIEGVEIYGESERNSGFSTDFLQTFGAWSEDPGSTAEIIEEIYRSRGLSTREINL